MCDDWHTWHPVLSPFEAGEYRVLRDWQVAVADVLLLREAWRLGSVHELYLSVERAVLDESYSPVWPRAAAPELCDVARLLGVPERAQIAALRFCLRSLRLHFRPPLVPLSPETRRPRTPTKPRVLFSAQLIADVTGAVGPAVSESLRAALSTLLRSRCKGRVPLCVYTRDTFTEDDVKRVVAVMSHGLVRAQSVQLTPDFQLHENGKQLSVELVYYTQEDD